MATTPINDGVIMPHKSPTHQQRLGATRRYHQQDRRLGQGLQKTRNSVRYRRFVGWFRRMHPLCQVCEKRGEVVVAASVHHIIPVIEDLDRVCDPANCIAVCSACHGELEN